MLLEMAQSATDKIIHCVWEWKTNQMQCVCWSSALDERDLELTMNSVNYKIASMQEMLVMGSLLSNAADTMSAVSHRMNKAMSAIRQTCT